MGKLFKGTPALWLTAASLLFWLGWNGLRTFKHPWGDLSGGTYTDHFSHMNAARAFPQVGLDIWRKPALELSRPATAEERAAWPADVHPGGSWKGGTYAMDGFPADKPWVTSWPQIPRLYPPGDMLLVAPVACAYQHTGMSLTQANRWLYALFLIYAHFAIFLILQGVLEEDWRRQPMLVIAAIATCVVMLVWTLQGFYDAAAIGPLLLCARFLRERRSLAAAVAFSVAAFIHFRAFFLAPWALYAAWLFFQQAQWRHLQKRDRLAALIGLFCAGAALFVLVLVQPTIANQAINNSANLTAASVNAQAVITFLLVAAVSAALLVYAKAWFDLATLLWLAAVILLVKEAHEWHIVIPLAWLVAPVLFAKPARTELVRLSRFLLLGYTAAMIMVN